MPIDFRVQVQFQKPLSFPDFDTKALKKAHREIGKGLSRIAKRLVSQQGLSRPEENPGRDSGLLRRSIGYRVSRSGFSVTVLNKPNKAMPEFYPAFVYYGHRGPGTDRDQYGRSDRRQQGRKRIGNKVAKPRNNWIVQSAELYTAQRYGAVMKNVLDQAIKPGVILK